MSTEERNQGVYRQTYMQEYVREPEIKMIPDPNESSEARKAREAREAREARKAREASIKSEPPLKPRSNNNNGIGKG